MNCRAFSQNPLTRRKSHHTNCPQIFQFFCAAECIYMEPRTTSSVHNHYEVGCQKKAVVVRCRIFSLKSNWCMHMTESTQSYQLKYLAQLIWLQTCQIRGGSERGRNKRVRSCTYSPVLCESHHPAFAFVIYIILWKRKSKRLPRSGVVPWQKGGSNPSSQVSPGQRPSITAHQVPLAQRPHISSHCSPYLPSTHSATQVDSCLWRLFAIEEKKEEEGEEERKKERKKERKNLLYIWQTFKCDENAVRQTESIQMARNVWFCNKRGAPCRGFFSQ